MSFVGRADCKQAADPIGREGRNVHSDHCPVAGPNEAGCVHNAEMIEGGAKGPGLVRRINWPIEFAIAADPVDCENSIRSEAFRLSLPPAVAAIGRIGNDMTIGRYSACYQKNWSEFGTDQFIANR